jgi:hypothetical protein
MEVLMRRYRFHIGVILLTLLVMRLIEISGNVDHAEPRYMFLTVTDFEAGISYRQAQLHAPIGQLTNPCSYADHFTATIDWNDGTGEHKPDTNIEKKMLQTVPVVENGTYLFWDDEHISSGAGAHIATTKVLVHCVGDPAPEREYTYRNLVTVYSRVPVNQVEFTKKGKSVNSVKGHDVVDLTITLDAPAPPSGSWVKLEVRPPGNLNSLPPFVRVSPLATQETIPNLELRRPSADMEVLVTASTVGRAQESQKLTVTP